MHINSLYSDEEKAKIKHYESAARALCALDGLDPDQNLQGKHPVIDGAQVNIPRWHTIVNAMANFDRMLIALTSTARDRFGPPPDDKQLELPVDGQEG